MPDYMRPQKEHDALGGVYDFLKETYGDAESREAHILGHAQSDVAWEEDQEGGEPLSREEREEAVQEAADELRLTYPVEEHTYTFIRDPDATTRAPTGPWGRSGKRATEWLIYTSKRPDGTWYGSIQRFTEKQTGVEDFDTILHDHPFEQEHAASERALLDDLIAHTHRWARRQNPRKKKNPRQYPRYLGSRVQSTLWHYLGRDILVCPDPDEPGLWVAEWDDPDCGCYFDAKTEQEALTMARDGIDEVEAEAREAKKKNPRRGPKPGTGGRPPKFTAAEKKRIVKAYREGTTAGEVGEEHGLSPITVLKFVREAGGEIRRGPSPGTGGRPPTVTPAEKKRIVKEYGRATAEEVGERWGLTGVTVLGFVREAGEEVRGPGIRPPKKRRRKKKAKSNPQKASALFRRLMRI